MKLYESLDMSVEDAYLLWKIMHCLYGEQPGFSLERFSKAESFHDISEEFWDSYNINKSIAEEELNDLIAAAQDEWFLKGMLAGARLGRLFSGDNKLKIGT